MELKNCPGCGKLFVDNPSGLCPDCYRRQEAEEQKVVEYLRRQKKASVAEIHNATGVEEKIIFRMVKRGRLYNDMQITYPCEKCGAPITTGHLCSTCSRAITDQLKPEEWKKPADPRDARRRKDRMYSKDHWQE